MAEKLIVELEVDGKGAFKSVTTEAKKAGKETGNKFGDGFSDSLKSSLKTAGKLAGIVASIGAALTFKESIQAAQVQEDAIKRLNNSLQASGEFSREATQELQDYAASLQDITRFGDEALINQLALAKSFGATNEQAKEIVDTATGLSEAFGIDLESATRNVAKTLGGFAGELGETIPQLKELTTEQLQAGAGIDLLSAKFAAQGKNLGTFSFTVAQLRNSFSDLLEAVGAFITQNPVILKALQSLTKIFKEAVTDVKEFVSSIDAFDDIVVPLTNFNNAVIQFVIAPLELLSNIFSVVQSGINQFAAAIIAGFGQIASAAGQLLAFVSPDSETAQALINFGQSSAEVFQEVSSEAGKSFDSLLDFPIAERLAIKNEELRTGLQGIRDVIVEENDVTKEVLNDSVQSTLDSQSQLVSAFGVTIATSTEMTKTQLEQQQKQVASIVKGGIARSISGGIQNIVNSLAKGEDAFANFGKFILSTFGDLAIQLGTFFIAQGIAVEALQSVSGTGAIAAGAALVALGSILKSFSGGSAESPSATASGAGAAQPGFDTASVDNQPEDLREPESGLIVNVQGDFLQTDESGERLAEIISESAAKRGTLISDIRFA